jgi:hypothetical protein
LIRRAAAFCFWCTDRTRVLLAETLNGPPCRELRLLSEEAEGDYGIILEAVAESHTPGPPMRISTSQ